MCNTFVYILGMIAQRQGKGLKITGQNKCHVETIHGNTVRGAENNKSTHIIQ